MVKLNELRLPFKCAKQMVRLHIYKPCNTCCVPRTNLVAQEIMTERAKQIRNTSTELLKRNKISEYIF